MTAGLRIIYYDGCMQTYTTTYLFRTSWVAIILCSGRTVYLVYIIISIVTSSSSVDLLCCTTSYIAVRSQDRGVKI